MTLKDKVKYISTKPHINVEDVKEFIERVKLLCFDDIKRHCCNHNDKIQCPYCIAFSIFKQVLDEEAGDLE